MINYRGIVKEVPTDYQTQYSVLVPVFQSNQTIKAYALTQKGIIPTYKPGDVVIVSELEPIEYFISGLFQDALLKESEKIKYIATESISADNGLLGTAILIKTWSPKEQMYIDTEETLGTLVYSKKQLVEDVSELRAQVSALQSELERLSESIGKKVVQ